MIFLSLGSNLSSLSGDNRFDNINGSIGYFCLHGFKEIKICTGYTLDGEILNYLPSSEKQRKRLTPIYETFKGWEESIVGIRELDDLPSSAKNYVKRIEELVGCQIVLISTSPERSDTIYIKDPFSPN